jgi:hypothetical protein
VRSKPDKFPPAVFVGALPCLGSIAASGLPSRAVPPLRHPVVALVSAESDSQPGIVTVGLCPLALVVIDSE